MRVGGSDGSALREALAAADVRLNASAEQLLADPVLSEARTPETITVVERTVADLGLSDGGVLSAIFAAAEDAGLALCPIATAAHLRLAWTDQENAPDSVLRAGRAPSGACTVASPRPPGEGPAGFYLRVIEGVPWLRGYHCDDEHRWSPTDRFIFRSPDVGASRDEDVNPGDDVGGPG